MTDQTPNTQPEPAAAPAGQPEPLTLGFDPTTIGQSLDSRERAAIAETILQQLGGNMFLVMVGGRQLVALQSGLQVFLPRCHTWPHRTMQVWLINDLYTLAIYEWRDKVTLQLVSVDHGIYADQLRAMFTKRTGLYTSF